MQALWHARHKNNDRILERVTSGIVFLGTPHLARSDEAIWRTLLSALKSETSNSFKYVSATEDISVLANISKQFEEIYKISELPILTVYETLGTKVQGRRFHRAKPTVVLFCPTLHFQEKN